jgi:uncharacterized DUF497 family protein
MIVIHKMIDLKRITGFDWDDGNARKNDKHGVSQSEAEEVFFNQPLLLLLDHRHAEQEPRFHALVTRLAGGACTSLSHFEVQGP